MGDTKFRRLVEMSGRGVKVSFGRSEELEYNDWGVVLG